MTQKKNLLIRMGIFSLLFLFLVGIVSAQSVTIEGKKTNFLTDSFGKLSLFAIIPDTVTPVPSESMTVKIYTEIPSFPIADFGNSLFQVSNSDPKFYITEDVSQQVKSIICSGSYCGGGTYFFKLTFIAPPQEGLFTVYWDVVDTKSNILANEYVTLTVRSSVTADVQCPPDQVSEWNTIITDADGILQQRTATTFSKENNQCVQKSTSITQAVCLNGAVTQTLAQCKQNPPPKRNLLIPVLIGGGIIIGSFVIAKKFL